MIKPRKSLGQNFFINNNLAKQIVQIVQNDKPKVIVEIGPGQGYFSNLFSKENVTMVMVEKDDTLAQNLSYAIQNSIVINKDFLDWDFKELTQYKREDITFFGSLPYNVSKKIIKKIIESEHFKNNAYFIIQKEVAEKYTEKQPNNSLLSLRTEIYADVKKLFDIKPESFNPRPKVTSSFTQFIPKEESLEIADLIKFDKFMEEAFKQPRKKLANNLKRYTFKDEQRGITLLEKRPQHLSLEEYILLFSNISQL